MKNHWLLPFIILLTFVQGCITPFEPEIEDAQSTIVIDGLITNKIAPYTVKISRSFAYDETDGDPVLNAIVAIEGDDGSNAVLQEKDAGIYVTNPDAFIGKTDVRYRLIVETVEGDRFESAFEKLNPAPPITNIEYRVEEKETSDPDKNIQGIQLYLDTQDPENKTHYYRWEYTETWEFVVPVAVLEKPDICYKTSVSKNISITSTTNLTQDKVVNFPLRFVSGESSRLSRRYSILIKQYSLSQEAYNYWRHLLEVNQNQGTLFDPIPYSLKGNVYNTGDTRKEVIGYFSASGISEKRIFITKNDLPEDLSQGSELIGCNTREDEWNEQEEPRIFPGWTYIYSYFDVRRGNVNVYVNFMACSDCSLSGNPEKPDFW